MKGRYWFAMLSFRCNSCLRGWPESSTFQKGMKDDQRGRCPYCGSQDIEEVKR